jgi:hypothetical protein
MDGQPLRTRLLFVVLASALLPWFLDSDKAAVGSSLDDVRPPVQVAVEWSGQPGLGRSVTLTVAVTAEVQADNLVVHWVVPDGAVLSGPVSEPVGPVSAGQTIRDEREVTFYRTGSFKVAISGQVEVHGVPAVYTNADVLFFSILPGAGSRVSRQGPRMASTRERIATPDVHYTETDEQTAPNGGYWVDGRVMYEDIPITPSGAGSPVLVPARQVKVEIWEEDKGLPDDHDGTTRTDDQGNFAFWVSDNDDGLLDSDGKETYLRIYPDTPGGYVTDRGAIDERYVLETGTHQGGQDIHFGMLTPTTLDPMFNISDVLLDGYRYISQLRSPPDRVKARFEPGYEPVIQGGSYYESVLERINLSGENDDPDGYDDTVILHEYGHFIADKYACDDSFGGDHDVNKHYNKRLAWSEGWANYLSSAVRGTPLYMDIDGAGVVGFSNWEDWTVTGSTNEGAVAATLWDLHDGANEAHDRLNLGGDEIWGTFQNRMGGSLSDPWHDCNIDAFWDGWLEAGYPDDSELAAIFAQYGTAGQHTAVVELPAEHDNTRSTAPTAPDTTLTGATPWDLVLFLVDATASMANEMGSVRQIVQNQVSDLDVASDPYEYVVETFQDDGTNRLVADHFFPDTVNPFVGAITAAGGGDEAEDAFAALARGTADRAGLNAWLLTDAPPKYEVTAAELEGLLQSRQITPYFFIFDGCSGDNAARLGVLEEEPSSNSLAPTDPLRLPRFSPADQAACIEAYLLAASAANGQLLLIDTSQIDDAAEIVRAFMNNNAGAGRYADYVSNSYTYAWDEAEYDWYDATGGDRYTFCSSSYVAVALPQPFSFYGNTYSTVYIARSGYVAFSAFNAITGNTGIPTAALPNNAVYAFWDDIWDQCVPRTQAPTQGRGVYTDYDAADGRFVIEYHDFLHVGSTDVETFEIMLDFATGDITLQYAEVTDDSSCTVGVENASGTSAVQVAYNQSGSLQDSQAILLAPMPPQPTRDHEVVVDSTMDGAIFFLNGYSGSVDLTLLQPDGTPVDTGDPDVMFLDVGKVKYYRVNDPAAGVWIARASGVGTYYFTSSAASPLAATYAGDVTLGAAVANPFFVELGMVVASASFSLVDAEGTFVDTVSLYDDGAHGDGQAGDGAYGGSYTAARPGTFYLQADGETSRGQAFRRISQTPIRFQNMRLVPPTTVERYAKPGDTFNYQFRVYNDTSNDRCFALDLQTSQGWARLPFKNICVTADSWDILPIVIEVPVWAGNVVERTELTVQGGRMADSGAMTTIVRGSPARVDLAAYPDRIAPNGGQATIVAQVADARGWNVADGTQVTLGTSLGTLGHVSATTMEGLVTATLTSGASMGTANVQVTTGDITEWISVEIAIPPAYGLTVEASPANVPADGASTSVITSHVYDLYGQPASEGTQVVFVIDGDDTLMGSVEGGEAYTATLSSGTATATYRSGTTPGWATIRAEIPSENPVGAAEPVAGFRWAETKILIGFPIYLPLTSSQTP